MSRALLATTAWVTRPSRLLVQVSLSDAGRASPCPSWFGVLSQSSVLVSKLPVLGTTFCVSLFTTSLLYSYMSFKALVILLHKTILSSLKVRFRFFGFHLPGLCLIYMPCYFCTLMTCSPLFGLLFGTRI